VAEIETEKIEFRIQKSGVRSRKKKDMHSKIEAERGQTSGEGRALLA
jgi:hypothetical protein